MKYENPFAEDDVPIELSLAALYEWLLTYGYEPVDSGRLYQTPQDKYLIWIKCVHLEVLELVEGERHGMRITSKVHEILKEYENGHRTDTTT